MNCLLGLLWTNILQTIFHNVMKCDAVKTFIGPLMRSLCHYAFKKTFIPLQKNKNSTSDKSNLFVVLEKIDQFQKILFGNPAFVCMCKFVCMHACARVYVFAAASR